MSRGLFVALAVMAVALVLLRPACGLWSSHHFGAGAWVAEALAVGAPDENGDPSAQCCSSVSDPNLTAPLQAASGGLQASQGFAAVALLAILVIAATLPRQLHWLRAPPRSPQSFHLRSARILR
ncbi:MAG: hypothetical protein HYX46_00080 [Betaproteobacteria bacterium]|nr:hypothetical protein [Betaproteobacteria bacterium]